VISLPTSVELLVDIIQIQKKTWIGRIVANLAYMKMHFKSVQP